MKSMRHLSGLSMKEIWQRVDGHVQLSMYLNLLAGYKEAFSHWYLPSTERESEQMPDALSKRRVGGYIIEGVLGVHCVSAEAERGREGSSWGDERNTSVQEQRRRATGQSRREQRRKEVVKVSMPHFFMFWIRSFIALTSSWHKNVFCFLCKKFALLLYDYLELIQCGRRLKWFWILWFVLNIFNMLTVITCIN